MFSIVSLTTAYVVCMYVAAYREFMQSCNGSETVDFITWDTDDVYVIKSLAQFEDGVHNSTSLASNFGPVLTAGGSRVPLYLLPFLNDQRNQFTVNLMNPLCTKSCR